MADAALNDEPLSRALGEIEAALGARQIDQAQSLAEAALGQGLRHPLLLKVDAGRLERLGRHDEAAARLKAAAALDPDDLDLSDWLGGYLAQLGRFGEAAAEFRRATDAAPARAASHYGLGWTLEQAGELEAARRAYAAAAEGQPPHAAAMGALAALAVRSGDLAEARRQAERALTADPAEPTATVALATAEIETAEFAGAEARLRALLARPELPLNARVVALGLLADALDGQDRCAEAFDAYTDENQATRRLHAPRFSALQPFPQGIAVMLQRFRTTAPEAWRTAPPAAPAPDGAGSHVFLIGFPRSGTTLLEQVLASHPGVVTLPERELLLDAARRLLDQPEGVAYLAGLSEEETERERRAYWNGVKGYGLDPAGKVFVDKLPLNTLKLPLIAKLFPNAKVLLALRDPRDVVLSAYRRHFDMNPAMYGLLTLEGAARFYGAVMEAALAYREALPLQWLDHRYEDLVADFDASTRALSDYLGVQWDESFRAFDRTARAQDIRTPSAAQVRRELYSGAGQWRRYEAQLAPVLPILQPWVERFGYEA